MAPREYAHAARVVAVVVRDHDRVDAVRVNVDLVQPAGQVARAEAGVDQHASGVRFDEDRVPAAPAPEACDAHYFLRSPLCRSARVWSHARRRRSFAPADSSILRRPIATSATFSSSSTRNSTRSAPEPQLNGGTYLGRIFPPNTLLPA